MNYRPHTTIILAMTADGKIADRIHAPARFASATDKTHLETQISLVDGVIFGAGTLRAYGTSLPIANSKLLQSRSNRAQSPQPIHIVASASGKIDSGLKFFQQPIPRWLLTTKKGSLFWQNSDRDSPLFERILIAEISPDTSSFIWDEILARLLFFGIHKLAILGGGELVASLLAIHAVDEIWLTICPVIFGGINSPTPVTGMGWLQSESIKLNLLQVQHIEQEVFLHYQVI
jgi:5-amino-6-(5-phosphoribosylamino)uracil reductase